VPYYTLIATKLVDVFNLKRLLLGISIIIAAGSVAFADSPHKNSADNSYVDETDLFEDVQTVVSATHLKQRITDAPVSVTIIDSDMIAASGATEVHELLRYVPGFITYSIWGNQFGVSNHIQPRDIGTYLEVQVNGRSVYEPLFTAVDWPILGIDIADIDYIEVVRGSSAPAYGSNAFLGAINIVTKSVLSRPKVSIRTRLGNIGRKELTLNKSGNFKDIDYVFSLIYKRNTGFPALKEIKKLRDLSNDDRDSLNLNFQGSYVPNLQTEIQFDVGLGSTSVEIPDTNAIGGYSTHKHESNYQRLKWINKGGEAENSLQLYHSYLGLDDDYSMGLISNVFGISPDLIPILFLGHHDEELTPGIKNSFSERFDIEFLRKSRVWQADYVWGVGARNNIIKSPTFIHKGEKTDERFRAFGNFDWRINSKSNLNVGVMAEHSKYSGLVFSPRLAINYHLKKNHNVRIGVTRGKRVPSATFQNYEAALRFEDGTLIDVDTIANGKLKTESISAYELSYIAQLPKLNTQLDIKLFREDLKDLVDLQIQPFDDLDKQVRVWDNILNFTTQGLEIQASYKFKNIPDMNARLAYAYYDTKGTYQKYLNEPNNRYEASSLPRHAATLLLSKKLENGFDVSGTFQFQSEYRQKKNKIKRLDLRLGKKFKLENGKAKLDFVVQNIFNKYNDFSPRNKFKTRAYIQLQLDF